MRIGVCRELWRMLHGEETWTQPIGSVFENEIQSFQNAWPHRAGWRCAGRKPQQQDRPLRRTPLTLALPRSSAALLLDRLVFLDATVLSWSSMPSMPARCPHLMQKPVLPAPK